MKIIELDSVDSTNEYCKRNFSGEDFMVVARRQTFGKGTKGRSFSSEEGGLYFSVVKAYVDFPAENAFKIMINTCVAVCKTLEEFGINPVIRWANDVLVGGKKICGTLIENTFSGGKIVRSVVGCGINVNNALPYDLKDIAVSMKEAAGKTFDLQDVKQTLIKFIKNDYSVDDYKGYINWFNAPVTLKTATEEFTATALDVLPDGRLKVKRGGDMLEISSAEVSLRI